MSYVRNIISKFGGPRAMARVIGRPSSTIAGWVSRGSIPDVNKAHVLDCAISAGIQLGPVDFFPVAPPVQAIEEAQR
jgi:hypothetical protein